MPHEPLVMWTIYERPKDFPHSYVARRWEVQPEGACPTNDFILGPTLEDVRANLPEGLHNLGRLAGDEEQIVETWV